VIHLLEQDEQAALRWCSKAVRRAWSWWRPALAGSPRHEIEAVESQVAIATGESAAMELLQRARRATSDLPTRGAPPPYAGHFYAALQELLDARLAFPAQRSMHIAECLSFCCVHPDGSRRASEIAACQ
jgi:hypothetical protein